MREEKGEEGKSERVERMMMDEDQTGAKRKEV